MKRVDLDRFFFPASIAIIGASQDFTKITGKPLYYLRKHSYQGRIYPVNPRYTSIDGIPCYPSIKDVPDDIDLALIAVNFRMVPLVLMECVEKGVKFATIFSSGFAEAGDKGKQIQEEVARIAREGGIRLCGPNCQGAVDFHRNIAAAFSAALDVFPLLKGSVGFVTQSGAMGFSIFNVAQSHGIGFSYLVSTGNEMDLTCIDFMNFMLDDDNTSMVFAYLEGIRNGEAFKKVAEKARILGKPLVVLKTGKSDVGSRAASSHTAALTGSDAVFSALCRQKGIICIEDTEEFIDLAKLMTVFPPTIGGPRLGIISTSGGGGVLCADIADDFGMKVSEFEASTVEKIRQSIPSFGSPQNPVDMTAQVINTADDFRKVLTAVAEDPSVDAIVVVITMIVGTSGTRMALDLARARRETQKPIVVVWTAGEHLISEQLKILEEARVPCYSSPRRALKALAHLINYGLHRTETSNDPPVISPMENILPDLNRENLRCALSEHQSKKILECFQISTTREECATSAEEAKSIANRIGYPVVVKIDSPDIPHKTEAGLVRLNIRNDAEVISAFNEMMTAVKSKYPAAQINGVLIQEMVTGGVEVIIGVKRDSQFGHAVMFGLGGIFVEIMKDVTIRIAPVDHREALKMIQEVQGYRLLEGARGSAKSDIQALAETIVRVSHLAESLPNLVELDINPLIVLPEGAGVKAVDALMIFDRP